MKYIKYLSNYFYSEENKLSNSQIIEDFGGLSPNPLTRNNFDIEFTIARTRRIGGLYASLLMIKRISHVKDSSEIHPSIHVAWKELVAAKNQAETQLKILSDSTKTKNAKFFCALVLTPIIFLMSPVLIPVIFYKITNYLLKIHKKIPKGQGYFMPLFKKETRIVINVGGINNKEDTKSIISHEHIHLLQNMNGEDCSKFSRCSDILLDSEYKTYVSLLYLLERNEVEARLHEIVISFYAISNTLPLTMEGFFNMLSGSNQFGSIVIRSMNLDVATNEQIIINYNARNTIIAEDLELILLVIKDVDLRRRFIAEVLAVMYGNLIKYYGDKESSLVFLRKIERPNLYDMLYA